MSNRSVAKHSRWWVKPVGLFVWVVMQLVCLTLRIRSERETSEEQYDGRVLMSIWHNRNLVCPFAWRVAGYQNEMGVMTSASKDGALLEEIVRHYGLKSFRGSSHRRGATAFLESLQSLQEGKSLTMTPDGPTGPIYKVRPGIIKLASLAQVPIIPICVEYENCWRINKSWDKYCIPKPFSKVYILWKTPFYVPQGLSDEELAQYVDELERKMSEGLPDFEPIDRLCKS